MKSHTTVLGDDISFQGSLQLKEPLTINGHFKGRIETPEALIVGSTGKIEADISASEIYVDGYVRGNIFADKKMKFHKSSQVIGDIRTPNLQIDSGSRFQGSCVME